MRLAKRITQLPPYFFAGLSQRVAEKRAKGIDIIDLSMGNPDLAPPQFILDALHKAAQNPSFHGYPGYYGTPAFRKAVTDWYGKRFGVELDPNKEVLALLGSKEAIAHLCQAFVDPGDISLASDPGYPTYHTAPSMAGGESYSVPLLAENDFLPDFSRIPEEVARRARLLWLNYPNNPTGAVAGREFFAQAVEFARKYDILVVHDNPYSEIAFDGYVAPSFLEVPGAKEVGVELHSLSKTYNMAGWRIGMAVGNAEAVSALARVKSNIDSGIFRPIQEAAVVALTGDQSWTIERNLIYQRRRDAMLEGLAAAGLKTLKPKGGLYIWTKVPEGYTSLEFFELLFEKIGVVTAVGTEYGSQGEGYLRISITTPEERMREAAERIAKLKF